MKQKLLSILALLMMAVTGAMAQTETLLTTITATAKEQASYSTANVATVSFSYTAGGSSAYLANWGWWGYGWSATVTAAEGYTITKCIFYDDANRTATDSEAPFVVETTEEDKTPRINGTPIDGGIYQSKGLKKIEVYGYKNPTYIVAGNNAEIFGSIWDGTYEANKMTKGDDGKYTKTYNVEDAFSDIQLKVVKDGQDWIGDETGFNVTFSMKQAGSFTVTLDPNANPVYVTVTGDNVVFANTEYAINYATGMQNGTVTGPDTAKEGDEVTLTITPAAGYVLESISVTGVTTENAVEVTDGKFTMPAEDVNVIATFKSVTYAIFAIDTDGTTQDFGSVEAGATAQKTFTITNSGNKSLYVTISNPENFTAEMTQNANLYFADALGWGDIHVYYWPNGPEWPGAAMTELYTNELGQKVYCYELPADVEGVIFNGNGNETGDINEPIGKAYYTMDEKVGNKYTVGTWSYDNCVPAGMSRVLTVTMNTATLGSKSGNITLSFDAKNATSFTIPCTGEVAAPTTYIVAGNNAEIFGSIWDGTYEANKMTKGDDGKYTKTYNVEDAFSDIQLKVVKDGQDWIGDETGFNVTFSMKQAGSFTVTLDPNANPVYVTVTGDNVVFANTEYAINYATGMQNGTVTGPDTAKEDDEVTLTITPAAGYVLESISVTGVTTENAVEVTDGKFTMPAENVNVIATFKSVTYSITVKEGTEDAGNWTVSPNPAEAGQTVTISYTGTKKVKSVKAKKKAVAPAATDLSTISADYEAKDGETLTGTLGSNVKISIADGATVALKDVTINGVNETSYEWAGITCAGDATITLEGTNTVKGFHLFYPGIYVPEGKTLTIEGEGSLNASGNGPSTGIGGGFYMHCGDIVINGGNITATGGNFNAGIGGGGVNFGDVGTVIRCGKITINGGTVTATGGESATGIGCGYNGASNDITITGGTVTATGGEYAAGIGSGEHGSCGAITISGGTVTATAVKWAAGIGGGNENGASGDITITSGVTKVTATKGSDCLNSIGSGDGGAVITVIIEDFDKVIQN